ncbi:MAG: OmpA family protein [Saprospiraceae bacterium]|nr:OmpA family protein [Saprospiraceae bacterium]
MNRFLILMFSLCAIGVSAQYDTISLRNPSFEDNPRKGGYYNNTAADQANNIKHWFDCGVFNFRQETAPDIHPSDYWSNTKQPSDGQTYLGMVTRDNDSWESVSQDLETPLKAGQCYSFSVELSKSERYISGSRLNESDKPNYNYTTPTVFRLWGGYSHCGTVELLAESTPVNNSAWKTYTFKLSPKANYRYITFEAFYKVPVVFPYNGHILIDNCSDIIQIDCDDELLVMVEEPETKLPPHKRVKQKKKPTTRKNTKSDNNTTVAASKPSKKILNLDRNKIRKGQTIEIQNLYFRADKTSIDTDSYEVLDEVYDFLSTNVDIVIEIGGHTNGVPPHDYCDSLSTDRAKVVAEYLVEKGIPEQRLQYKGYGKRKSIASNLTKEGRKKNQRVEIKILSIG